MSRRLLVPRRNLLKGLGASAALPALTSCKDGGGDTGSVLPGSIDTIVLCMMENRSFDHVFGSYSLLEGRTGVDGFLASHQCPDLDGVMHGPSVLPEPCTTPDPPHGWGSWERQFKDGAMTGFIEEYQASRGPSARPDVAMSYQTRAMQPLSYALADEYALCQRWFASVRGPTWPNRLYFHSASSEGETSNDLPTGFYTQKTLWDQLDEIGVPWGYYYSDLPTIALFGRIDNSFFIEQFYADAAAGALPPVVVVDAGNTFNDDHPPHHPMLGQIFLSSIYQALATGPQWDKCLFLYTYDECGGFYDHVPPPTAPDDRKSDGFDQLGFRVPAVAAGPYVKQGHISDVVYDHTSAMKHVQNMFGLDPLSKRNAWAPDLSDLIDTDRLDRGEPRPPVEVPVIEITEEELDEQCASTQLRKPGQPELHDLVETHWPAYNRTSQLPRIGRELVLTAERLGACKIV